MKLLTPDLLRQEGIESFCSRFVISCKNYENKVLLNYSQIESPFAVEAVQECRGLILRKSDFTPISLAFKKFFNLQEGLAAQIDWNTARAYDKLDGSMIQLYFDEDLWHAATTGTAEGEGSVDLCADPNIDSFSTLFWHTVSAYKNLEEFTSLLDPRYIYVFELCTPFNIVVVRHTKPKVTLLTVRHQASMMECPQHEADDWAKLLGVDRPSYKTDVTAESLIEELQNVDYSFEGYVVLDAQLNRIKIKSPAYIRHHHLRSSVSINNLVEAVLAGETEEILIALPQYGHIIHALHQTVEQVKLNLSGDMMELSLSNAAQEFQKNPCKETRKNVAMLITQIAKNRPSFTSGALFNFLDSGMKNAYNSLIFVRNSAIIEYVKSIYSSFHPTTTF